MNKARHRGCYAYPDQFCQTAMVNLEYRRTCKFNVKVAARLLCLLISTISACSSTQHKALDVDVINAQDLLTVDCLLPPQVRQLGTEITYLAPRRAIRTAGAQCALRGGEYVAYDRADFASALAIWMPKARQGDPEAQTYVGEIYEKGLGTPASYEIAAQWYQRAVEQDYARAQTNLGYLYESGLGVERDLPRALNLYRQASGFTSAELEFVSSVEIARRESTRAESALLSSQVQLLQDQIRDDQQKLLATLRQLAISQQQVDKLRTALNEQHEHSTENKTAELQDELHRREASIESLKLDVQNLKESMTGTQASLSPDANVERVSQIQPLGPSINIIDPPVLLTRGSPSLIHRGSSPLRLIGRVEPAESLFAFRINGEDHPVSDSGMFQFTDEANTAKSLDMLAVDQQGISARLTLSVPQQAVAPEPKMAEIALAAPPSLTGIEFGSYHALIIGNDTYDNLNNLKTAGKDAIAVERVLREKYGFNTVLLLNANQKTTLMALERMRATLTGKDNLVIYYAGHGELDIHSGNGYWLPIDAQATNKDKWIANSAITAMIDSMDAKHVLIIADSCYSGSLTQASVARALPQSDNDLRVRWLKAVSRSRVRTVLSSGGNRPVLDGSLNAEHSVFAGVFLQLLQKNTRVLETYELFYQLQQRVATDAARLNVEQVPQYAPIRHSGHQAGEFLFVPRSRLQISASKN